MPSPVFRSAWRRRWGIIVSILGIVFVWRLVPGTTERLVDTATFAQRALDSTEDLLAVADNDPHPGGG